MRTQFAHRVCHGVSVCKAVGVRHGVDVCFYLGRRSEPRATLFDWAPDYAILKLPFTIPTTRSHGDGEVLPSVICPNAIGGL
jgi:hypothetical protein